MPIRFNTHKKTAMTTHLEKKQCIKVLKSNYIGHLGYIFQNRPIVVPITYFYSAPNNSIICYSADGKKIKAMRINKYASLAVENITSLNHWESVLVEGTFEELIGIDAKNYLHQFALGVKRKIAKKEGKDVYFISEFSSALNSMGIPIVYRINIQDITGNQRLSENYRKNHHCKLSKSSFKID